MKKVKCSHCGLEFNKSDTIPCTWKEIEPGKDFTWYYCKTCNKCFTNGVSTQKEDEDVIIKKSLANEIYNELVCCRKLREEFLLNYCRSNDESDIDDTLDWLQDNIEHTEKLYKELFKQIKE